MTSQKAQRAKSEAFREPDRGCSPHRSAYNCAVGWEKRNRVLEPGTSAAWRSFSAMAARSISSLISAQSAGTNVVLYREYKLRPELVETGNAGALPYTVTRFRLATPSSRSDDCCGQTQTKNEQTTGDEGLHPSERRSPNFQEGKKGRLEASVTFRRGYLFPWGNASLTLLNPDRKTDCRASPGSGLQ